MKMKNVISLALLAFDQVAAQNMTATIGRDSQGHFKNHERYLAVLNDLNEAESTHSKMFKEIEEKLNEPAFIQSAAQS